MRKTEPRYKVDFEVTLNWQGQHGVSRAKARCSSLSASGAQIQTLDQLPLHSVVLVMSQPFGRMGSAVVRNIRRIGMRYELGIQFAEPLRLTDPARQAILQTVLSSPDTL